MSKAIGEVFALPQEEKDLVVLSGQYMDAISAPVSEYDVIFLAAEIRLQAKRAAWRTTEKPSAIAERAFEMARLIKSELEGYGVEDE